MKGGRTSLLYVWILLGILMLPVAAALIISAGAEGTTAQLAGGFWDRLLNRFSEAIQGGQTLEAVLTSLILGILCGGAALVPAALLAACLKLGFKRKRRAMLFWIAIAPLFASYHLKTYAMRMFFAQGGPLQMACQSIGFSVKPLVDTQFGVCLYLVLAAMPFATVIFFILFEGIADQTVLAARNLGAGELRLIKQLLMPVFRKALFTAFCFGFFFVFGDSLAAEVVGGGQPYVIGMWTKKFYERANIETGAAAALLQMLFTAALLMLMGWLLTKTTRDKEQQ